MIIIIIIHFGWMSVMSVRAVSVLSVGWKPDNLNIKKEHFHWIFEAFLTCLKTSKATMATLYSRWPIFFLHFSGWLFTITLSSHGLTVRHYVVGNPTLYSVIVLLIKIMCPYFYFVFFLIKPFSLYFHWGLSGCTGPKQAWIIILFQSQWLSNCSPSC